MIEQVVDDIYAYKINELRKRQEELEKELANFGDARSIADNIRLQLSQQEMSIADIYKKECR